MHFPCRIYSKQSYYYYIVFTELPKSPVSLRTKAMKLCIILCESTVAVFPTLIFILLTFAPCTPPFILSMLPNCQPVQTTLLGRGIQGLIHLYEIWTISHITYSGSIWIFYILFVGIDCMLNYLNLLKRSVNSIALLITNKTHMFLNFFQFLGKASPY